MNGNKFKNVNKEFFFIVRLENTTKIIMSSKNSKITKKFKSSKNSKITKKEIKNNVRTSIRSC